MRVDKCVAGADRKGLNMIAGVNLDRQRGGMNMPATPCAEYALSETFFQQLTGKVVKQLVAVLLPAVVAGWYISGAKIDATGIAALMVVLGVFAASVWFNVRRQHHSLRTFRLTVDQNLLMRTQEGFPPLTFSPGDIAEIMEGPRGITVIGTDRRLRLVIPATLEHFDDFRTQLALIHPITVEQRNPTAGVRTVLISLAVAAGMLVVYRSHDPRLVLSTGTLLAGVLVWSFVAIQRSPVIEQRVKRVSWILIFPLFSLGTTLYSAIEQLTAS